MIRDPDGRRQKKVVVRGKRSAAEKIGREAAKFLLEDDLSECLSEVLA
jgi:hypothetical protein